MWRLFVAAHYTCPSESRDKLVGLGKDAQISAAVVFLPEHTVHYGKHRSEKCHCIDIYGELKPW